MKNLRASARQDTKMIFLELVVPYACHTDGRFAEVPGADLPAAPYPLLANLGPASGFLTYQDMQVRCFYTTTSNLSALQIYLWNLAR